MSPIKHFKVFVVAILLPMSGALMAQPEGVSPKTEAPIPDYRIGAGDTLQIDVWKEPDASIPQVTVRPDGKISVPILGELHVAGRTPGEVQKQLAEQFGSVIREPRVTVSVREVVSQRVFLIGEVRREGPVRFVGPITVLQALAEAGGLTDYAKRKKIYILRIAGGNQVHLPFDYDAVVRGQKVQQNVTLWSGDTIVVPR